MGGKDSVNPVPTEQSGATNLHHGSRLQETPLNAFFDRTIHLLASYEVGMKYIHPELSNHDGRLERTMIQIKEIKSS